MRKMFFLIFVLFPASICAYYFPFTFTGAAPMGMGNAYTAIAEATNAAEYNPAGLADMKGFSISVDGGYLGYNFRYSETETVDFASWAGKMSFTGFNACLAFEGRAEGDTRVKSVTLVTDPDGNTKTYTGPFMQQNAAIIAAYGVDMGDFLLGAAVHLFSSYNILWGQSFGEGLKALFDLGLLCRLSDEFSFGISFLRFGGQLYSSDYSTISDFGIDSYTTEEPASLNIGIAYRPVKELMLAFDTRNVIPADVLFMNDPDFDAASYMPSLHLGAEYNFTGFITGRAGLIQEWLPARNYTDHTIVYGSRTTVTLGFSIQWEGFSWDAAIANDFRNVYNVHNPFQFFSSVVYKF